MNEDREIRFLGDLQRLELKPGDMFVLKCPGHLSDAAMKQIRELFERSLPGHKVLVLDAGMEIGLIGGADAVHPA